MKQVISETRNNLTESNVQSIIYIGDENVKKRNLFIKNKRIL